MDDNTVNVRYMVDDVDAAVAFYTTHFDFTADSNAAPAFRRCDPREAATAAQRPRKLGRTAHAGRAPAGARGLNQIISSWPTWR